MKAPPSPTIPITHYGISDALALLAKRDSVAISVRSHYGETPEWTIVEVEAVTFRVRSARGTDYAASLADLRATPFDELPKPEGAK